jgi:hypothetical protein
MRAAGAGAANTKLKTNLDPARHLDDISESILYRDFFNWEIDISWRKRFRLISRVRSFGLADLGDGWDGMGLERIG